MARPTLPGPTLTGPTRAERAESEIAGRAGRVEGLRQLADWLEAHPEVPPPQSLSMNMWGGRQEAAVDDWLSDVDFVTLHESYFEDSHPALIRHFGGIGVSLYVDRETLGFPMRPQKPKRGSDQEWSSSALMSQMRDGSDEASKLGVGISQG